MADGMALSKAVASVGRTRAAYLDWRHHDKDFARKVDEIRLRRRDDNFAHMDFVEFRDLYFNRPTAIHHHRMVDAIEKAEPDTVTLVLGFPEMAKTSLLVDRINYVLGPVNPDYRFAVISEGQDLARKIVGQVASRMTDENTFRAYIERYGPFKAPDRSQAKPWNADYLQILRSHRDEKEPSLEARGAGSTLYGGRYDEIWLDDIQSERNLNQTPQLLRYIRQTVLTRPAKGVGKVGMVGSLVGSGDIYEKMQDEEMVDYLVTIPALTEWVAREDHFVKVGKDISLAEGCPEVSAWPGYWSMLDLAKRRAKVGEEIWARTYMQRHVTDAGAAFSDEMLDAVKDPDRALGVRGGLGTDLICAVDPALDTGVCAFIACAVSPEKLWVIDLLQRTDIYRYEDIYAQIGAWSARYRPSTWIVEQNNFQKGLHQDDRMQALAAKFRFSAIPHQTSRNKNDPVMGVGAMASAFVDKEVSLPWGDEAARHHIAAIVDQAKSWRPRAKMTQDCLMALWFAWLHWESQRSVLGSTKVTQLWRPSWMRRAG